MRLTRTRISAFVPLLLATATTLAVIVYCQHKPRPGPQLGRWETSNKGLRIRIVEYDEKGALIAGTYYLFESAKPNTNQWQKVVMFRHDDRVEIPAARGVWLDIVDI